MAFNNVVDTLTLEEIVPRVVDTVLLPLYSTEHIKSSLIYGER
jgi:hypothetical protein